MTGNLKGNIVSVKKRTNYPSLCFNENGKAYVGGSNGYIYQVNASNKVAKCSSFDKVHTKAIQCMRAASKKVLSCGRDGKIRVWSMTLVLIEEIDTGYLNLRSVDLYNSNICCLTSDGRIMKYSFDEGTKTSVSKGLTVLRSHHDGEVWGLAYHNGNIFTVGDDNLLMEWDI